MMPNNPEKLTIYRFRNRLTGTEPLGIYLIDSEKTNQILMIPLTPEPLHDSSIKLSITRQYADIQGLIYINKSNLISPLYVDSKPATISQEDLLQISYHLVSYILESVAGKINTSLYDSKALHELLQSTVHFMNWQQLKYQLCIMDDIHVPDIYENAVYWANIGYNIGAELNKNRPVLIWKKRINKENKLVSSYIVIPITSKNHKKSYDTNVPITIDDRQSYLRIEDIRRISIKRITKPILNEKREIIFIDAAKRVEVKEALRTFFIFDNQYTL